MKIREAKYIDEIIIHCSATPPKMDDIDASIIRTWHLKRGWHDIGYHYVITRDGGLEMGRDVHVMGAHCRGRNANSIGICLVGGVDDFDRAPQSNYTPEQWDTLQGLLRESVSELPIKMISGHNEWSTKACPSFSVPDWVRAEASEFLPYINPKQRLIPCKVCGRG